MKKLLSFAFILCCAVLAVAQERVMDKSEFDSVVANGNRHRTIWKDEKYRMTVTTSSKTDGRPTTDWRSKIIIEYGTPPEKRSLSSSMFGDKVNPTMETIRVGEWLYLKSGDGPWTRKKDEPVVQKENEPLSMQVIRESTEYKHLGAGKLGDVPVQIYVKNEKATKVGKTSGEAIETDSQVTYWIDSSGVLLKSEFNSENRGRSMTGRTLITTIWERDPSIKFTVPEIAVGQSQRTK